LYGDKPESPSAKAERRNYKGTSGEDLISTADLQHIRKLRSSMSEKMFKEKQRVRSQDVNLSAARRRSTDPTSDSFGVSVGGVEVQMSREARKGNLKFIVDMLRKGRTTVDKRNPENGRCVLHEAVAFGHKSLVKALVNSFDANPNIRTYLGRETPLHLAAANGHRAICFLLIIAGANPFAVNQFSAIPLHYAATRNTARVLIEYGSKVHQKNKFGHTCIQTVAELGHSEVAEYMQEHLLDDSAHVHVHLRGNKKNGSEGEKDLGASSNAIVADSDEEDDDSDYGF